MRAMKEPQSPPWMTLDMCVSWLVNVGGLEDELYSV